MWLTPRIEAIASKIVELDTIAFAALTLLGLVTLTCSP
jgi:hypothetical protein